MPLGGILLLLFVAVSITVGWFVFSADWDKQFAFAKEMASRRDAVIAADVPFKMSEDSIRKEQAGYAGDWRYCDLLLLKEGLAIRGHKNSNGFYNYIFLWRGKENSSAFRSCPMRGVYQMPDVRNGKLYFSVSLSVPFFGELQLVNCEFSIRPGEKALLELKQAGMIYYQPQN